MTSIKVNNKTQLNKLHATEHKGYRLGTPNATWKKIKSTANNGSEQPPINLNTIVESGPDGEIVILHKDQNCIEIWEYCNDSFYITTQIDLQSDFPCFNFHVISKSNDVYTFAVQNPGCFRIIEYNFKNSQLINNQEISLPKVFLETDNEGAQREIKMKSMSKILAFSNTKGWIAFIRKLPNTGGYAYIKSTDLPLIYQNASEIHQTEEECLLLKTSTFDDSPIFDLVGNWLVFAPTKLEHKLLRTNNEHVPPNSPDEIEQVIGQFHLGVEPSISKKATLSPSKYPTEVCLPPPGLLLNRVVSSLSNSALDGLSKISEAGSKKMKEYWKGQHSDEDMIQYINKLGKSIYKTASSTAQSLNPRINDNQLIKIVDLVNDKILAIFRPPGGVSSVSLSPYDLQMVHSNLRGDLFFMWDLCKLPKKVSLIGKFTRGKTSATIGDIFWHINKEASGENNYGFGCITKNSGSIHWFNINYLSGSLNCNFPNSLKHKRKQGYSKKFPLDYLQQKSNNNGKEMKYDDFSDAWILSCLKSIKFFALPIDNMNSLNQLAVLDSKNELRLISPLNGNTKFKYELPTSATPQTEVFKLNIKSKKLFKPISINPLIGAEIETCGPYPNLFNSKNITLETYNTDNCSSDIDNFLSSYKFFGEKIPTSIIHFEKDSEINEVELIDGVILEQTS